MTESVEYCLNKLSARGFDKAQVHRRASERDELQAELGQPSLFRTVANTSLSVTAFINGKRASATLNKEDRAEIDQCVDSLWLAAQASVSDEANDIAEQQTRQSFSDGTMTPDRDAMYDRLAQFLSYVASTYPTVIVGAARVSHVRHRSVHANSNGVRFESESGCYQTSAHFSAKRGGDVSSLNGTFALVDALNAPIAETSTYDRLLRGATEQVRTQKVANTFVGNLIISPDCVGTFIGFLVDNLGAGPMVAGTSIYKDKLGERVACNMLTVRSTPCSSLGGYRVTNDCYPAHDVTVVRDGVLRSFFLDLYASRKTGLERSSNTGGNFSIDAGATPLKHMIGEVDHGILIGRFSGGRPSADGDFSGVAKNSYLIENGKVTHPLSETMVSGNMARLLHDVTAISIERADFGVGQLPWLRTGNVTIS